VGENTILPIKDLRNEADPNNKGTVKVRIVTGDMLETAKNVALEVGIINNEEDEESTGKFCLKGDDLVDKLNAAGFNVNQYLTNPAYNISKDDLDLLESVISQIKVLAYCTPQHKLLFVGALRDVGAVVVMAGESITDTQAMKTADVGISLKQGCDVAKDNADLVLLQNNFEQIKSAIMWGRQLYMNVQKFLVFQLTVNLVIIITTIVGGCIGHVPFNVLQMLWLNLIMDVLGAIALCTEPWANGVNLPRVSRTKSLLLPDFWKLIFVQAAFQTIVILILMFFYGMMRFGDAAPNLFTDPLRDKNGNATNRLKMDTFIFHTFVLMCIFNQLNCRNVTSDNLNPFQNIQNHLVFVGVWVFEIAIQQAMVVEGSNSLSVAAALLGTAHLEWQEHLIAYILAACTLGVGIAAKKIPASAFEWTKNIGLEK
jgi:Ca2+-transporting ATPase